MIKNAILNHDPDLWNCALDFRSNQHLRPLVQGVAGDHHAQSVVIYSYPNDGVSNVSIDGGLYVMQPNFLPVLELVSEAPDDILEAWAATHTGVARLQTANHVIGNVSDGRKLFPL